MKLDGFKRLLNIDYRILIGFGLVAGWLVLEIVGENWNHYTLMVVESLIVFPLAFFMSKFWRMYAMKSYIGDADKTYMMLDKQMVLDALPAFFELMKTRGYEKRAYMASYPDCDDFSARGKAELNDMLSEGGKPAHVREYSFRRNNGARHRLVAVETNAGWLYVENYPVFDKYHTEDGYLRILSKYEKKNGVLI